MSGFPRCVLFDLDGTLVNSYRLYMESFRATLEPHFRRRLSDPEILAFDPHAEQRLLLSVLPEIEFNEYFELFLTHYARFHEALFDGLYDGVLDMLRTLQTQGYLMGVVTGKSREAWRITSTRMEDLGFDELFDVVMTDDDVQSGKPNPEGIMLALDTLDVQPEQALYIGDSQRDHDAAEAAGVTFGISLWARKNGQHAFPDLAPPSSAEHAFRAPSEVLAMLNRTKIESR